MIRLGALVGVVAVPVPVVVVVVVARDHFWDGLVESFFGSILVTVTSVCFFGIGRSIFCLDRFATGDRIFWDAAVVVDDSGSRTLWSASVFFLTTGGGLIVFIPVVYVWAPLLLLLTPCGCCSRLLGILLRVVAASLYLLFLTLSVAFFFVDDSIMTTALESMFCFLVIVVLSFLTRGATESCFVTTPTTSCSETTGGIPPESFLCNSSESTRFDSFCGWESKVPLLLILLLLALVGSNILSVSRSIRSVIGSVVRLGHSHEAGKKDS
mmetsp:Transcript_14700/g.26680  ORF Transcript_14700/g.26680 Transcript_14700/m.26680 type:complete len:268 (-) Transcript_14700:99-902(-)